MKNTFILKVEDVDQDRAQTAMDIGKLIVTNWAGGKINVKIEIWEEKGDDEQRTE
jgi:hypothetical protein